MTIPNIAGGEGLRRNHVAPTTYADHIHANATAVSWGAILVGAVAAAALSLILLMLGAGLGLSSVSPWSHEGIGKASFGVSSIVWITITQILAAGMGGYLAGRLRTKWSGVHTDEVYFRDTAHGFMAWAVATLATAALLTSAIGSVISGAAHAGAVVAGSAAATAATATVAAGSAAASDTDNSRSASGPQAGTQGGAMGYFIDSLFRPDPAGTSSSTSSGTSNNTSSNTSTSAAGKSTAGDATPTAAPSTEVTRIFVNAVSMNTLPPADAAYVGHLVAQRTGMSQQDAEKRVNDVFASIEAKKTQAEAMAKSAADKLRKATVYLTLWLFVSFLFGAFSASLAATWGGRERDA